VQKQNTRFSIHSGFTLIELLVVMSIIVVLLLLVLAIGRSVRQKSMVDDTKARLKIWQTIVLTYQSKSQTLPSNHWDPNQAGVNNTGPYHWFYDESGDPTNPTAPGKTTPMLVPVIRRLLTNLGPDLATQRNDAWGRPVYYRCLCDVRGFVDPSRTRLQQEPFFWSLGPDGKANFLDPTNKVTDPSQPGYSPDNIYNLDNIFSFN